MSRIWLDKENADADAKAMPLAITKTVRKSKKRVLSDLQNVMFAETTTTTTKRRSASRKKASGSVENIETQKGPEQKKLEIKDPLKEQDVAMPLKSILKKPTAKEDTDTDTDAQSYCMCDEITDGNDSDDILQSIVVMDNAYDDFESFDDANANDYNAYDSVDALEYSDFPINCCNHDCLRADAEIWNEMNMPDVQMPVIMENEIEIVLADTTFYEPPFFVDDSEPMPLPPLPPLFGELLPETDNGETVFPDHRGSLDNVD